MHSMSTIVKIDAINDEQAALRQVIDLLKNLKEQQTPPTRAPMEKYLWKFTILTNHGPDRAHDDCIGDGPDRAHDDCIGDQDENGEVPYHFCMLNVQGFIIYEIPGHSNVRSYEIVT